MHSVMRHIFMTCLLCLVAWTAPAFAVVDNELYAQVLDAYVNDGLVDYAGLQRDRAGLDAYLSAMGRIEVDKLDRDERLAFYLNLYNAATLRLIVDHYPVDSIKDIGFLFASPWKRKEVMLEGRLVTLDYIEHDVIRPVFQEPRIHFAVNCSALSCPPLLGTPYEGARLDAQLEAATIAFINDPKHNYLDGRTLYVTKLLRWFSEDFPEDRAAWVLKYARGDLRLRLLRLMTSGEGVRIRFLNYDWGLNRQP